MRESTLFKSIQSKLICQLGHAVGSSGNTIHLLKATGVICDLKPQSQVVLPRLGGHTGEMVERNPG